VFPYPATSAYTGNGDVNSAANYVSAPATPGASKALPWAGPQRYRPSEQASAAGFPAGRRRVGLRGIAERRAADPAGRDPPQIAPRSGPNAIAASLAGPLTPVVTL
jgi:hypothetical protein